MLKGDVHGHQEDSARSDGVDCGVGWGGCSSGEVTGNGKAITINARSECAFSGLEDGDGNPPGPGFTQNWGQIPKADRDFLRTIGVSPEALCNAHLNPIK